MSSLLPVDIPAVSVAESLAPASRSPGVSVVSVSSPVSVVRLSASTLG